MLRSIMLLIFLGPLFGWLVERYMNEREYQKELLAWQLRKNEREYQEELLAWQLRQLERRLRRKVKK